MVAYTTINVGDLYGTGWATTAYASGDFASSATITYSGTTEADDSDDSEESALDWLDRRVDEMRVKL